MLCPCFWFFIIPFFQDFTQQPGQMSSEGEEDDEDEAQKDDDEDEEDEKEDVEGMSKQRLEESLPSADSLPEESALDDLHDDALKRPVNAAPEVSEAEDKTDDSTQPANGTAEILPKSQSGSTKKLSFFRRLSNSRTQQVQAQPPSLAEAHGDSHTPPESSQSSSNKGLRSSACSVL
ncbi:nucleolin-like [Dunckerocampus dactyliophorus]|uniref:nucleolin-like n=1 Tax=Dunckerocampus dactyliophorus TaxID=161453 RepID=UPI002405AF77|nr:nucleolin-like [Dunckerocampus dactyliophorus]